MHEVCDRMHVLHPRTSAFTVLPADIAAVHESRSKPFISLSLLGRIPSTGEYKVLRIHWYFKYNKPGHQTCEVMALGNDGGDGRWSAMASPPVHVRLDGVVVNGAIYLLSDSRYGEIASFNLATEEWRPGTLQGPPLSSCDQESSICFNLAKLNGSLVTICRYYRLEVNYTDRMDLWFSVDMDKGLWTKLYTLQCTPRCRCGLTSPLEVLNDGRILLWEDEGKCIRVYDPKTNISTDVAKLKNFSSVCKYEGSLLC
ncbi:hypothetical protein HU200_015942 [Digitaria exilis]|uniref:F-box associated beta-propeller type 3 domain-containing protein n=1 Tax=Digitaria exilis TaxID=1010633 RepID=A0A835F8L8_9POAL|nr:hypothetical protein HU200_015942 [Digitaria exilis]